MRRCTLAAARAPFEEDSDLGRISDRLIEFLDRQVSWGSDLAILVILLERVREGHGWTPLEFAVESARRALVRGAEIEGVVDRDDARLSTCQPSVTRRMLASEAKTRLQAEVIAEERRKHDLDLLERQQEIIQLRAELDRRDRVEEERERMRIEDQRSKDEMAMWPGHGAG